MNKGLSRVPGRRGLLAMGLAAVVALIAPVPHARADQACAGRYDTISVPGTVLDNDTKLVWQQDVAPGTYPWDANASLGSAQAYCNNLPLAGVGWRLPTIFELQTIVDDINPAIDSTAFPNTPPFFFWSSSAYAGSPSNAWYVNFYDGSVDNAAVGHTGGVRCVR